MNSIRSALTWVSSCDDVIDWSSRKAWQLGWYTVVSIQLDFISIFSPKSLIIFVADILTSSTIQMHKFGTPERNKKAQLSLTNPRDLKACQNCSNSTCLQRCRWQYWSIFIRLAVVASEICKIPRNFLKIQTYRVQGHPRSSILVSIESAYATFY